VTNVATNFLNHTRSVTRPIRAWMLWFMPQSTHISNPRPKVFSRIYVFQHIFKTQS